MLASILRGASVTKVTAENRRRTGEGERSRFQLNEGWDKINVGNVEVAWDQAPQQEATVITGDVIDINCGGCN